MCISTFLKNGYKFLSIIAAAFVLSSCAGYGVAYHDRGYNTNHKITRADKPIIYQQQIGGPYQGYSYYPYSGYRVYYIGGKPYNYRYRYYNNYPDGYYRYQNRNYIYYYNSSHYSPYYQRNYNRPAYYGSYYRYKQLNPGSLETRAGYYRRHHR